MKKELRDFITAEEMKAFEERVDAYAAKEFGGRTVSGHHLLRFWESAKSEYLFKMFGGEKLILSKNISFMKDGTQLYRDMDEVLREDEFTSDWNSMQNKYWNAYLNADFDRQSESGAIYEVMNFLTRPQNLIDNIYTDPTVVIKTPEGKELKIQQGCKVMRTIGKIASAFNMDMDLFEQFRIKISQVLNQRKLSGELCISIHPLDYSTMSDNESDWASCMSWEDYGCYRQGTVEMMNSPMVVVAYLNSASPMQLETGLDWSNKKWRELFIVNREIITNIKSYPYHNPNLSKAVLSWLKELVDTNLTKEDGFDFYPQEIEYEPYCHVGIQYSSIEVRPECNFMYNDFGNDPYANWAYFKRDLIKEEAGDIKYRDLEFNYSGESECLGCGETCDFYDNEGGLMGECCDAYFTCEYCGDNFHDEYDLEEVDGQMLCQYCLEEYCSEDAITGDLHITQNMVEVHLFSKKNCTKEIGRPILVYSINNLACGKYFSHIHKYDYINCYYPEYYFVYAEDATKEGLALFALEDTENIDKNPTFETFITPEQVVNVREYKDLAQFKYGDYQIENYKTLYPRGASTTYLSEAVLATDDLESIKNMSWYN